MIGKVALTGRIPLGYYNAPEKSAETFVEIDGQRWVITGDAATVEEDGTITLFGRGSVSINTGGEKVFPEEVEAALKSHPVGVRRRRRRGARRAMGRDRRRGRATRRGATPTLEELAGHCREHVAGYKVPRRLVLVDEVVRSPVGKADYPWAKRTAAEAARPVGTD